MPTLNNETLTAGQTLNLNFGTDTLTGSALFSGMPPAYVFVTGPGVLDIASGATASFSQVVFDQNAQFKIDGTLLQTGFVQYGTQSSDAIQIGIDAGGNYDLTADANISSPNIASFGTATITVASGGNLAKTGGTGTSTIYGIVDSNGGGIVAASGTLALTNYDLFGALGGAGVLVLGGSGGYLGAAINVATLDITAANTTLLTSSGSGTSNIVDTGALNETGQIALNSQTLTLDGVANLNGTITGPAGTLVLAGFATLAGFANTTSVIVTGTVAQSGTAQVDVVTVTSTGTYDIVTDATIDLLSATNQGGTTAGFVTNGGLFEKNGGGGTSVAFVNLTNSGTLAVATGTLDLASPGTSALGGTITGAGVLTLGQNTGGGVAGANVIQLAAALINVATLNVAAVDTVLLESQSYGGVLMQTGEVDISGFTLTLSGTDVLESFVNGPGTLALGGQATLANFTDRATVIVTGAVTQTGTAQFGSLPLDQAASTDQIAVTIAAGGSYNLAADVNVNNTNTALDGLATFTNAGLLEKTAAGGISKLFVDVVSSGTILATAGNELDIESIATSALNGTITGAGTLFLGRDLFTIDTTVLNIATLDVAATDTTLRENLAYGGVLNQTARIDIAAFTFTLTGTDNLDSLINGTGTLVLAGVANLANFTDTATVTVTGTANQNAVTQFGTASGATVQVGIVAGGIYDLASDTNIDTSATNGLATFTNAGLLEKTAATGTSTLFVNVVNNATILAASGNLAFADTVAGTGTLDIAANSRLTLAAGSTNGVLFEGAGAVLAVASGMQVTGPLNGLALGDTIDVQGLANAPVSFIVGTGNVGTLLVGTNVFTVDGGYGGLFFDATTDGNGGTDVVVSTVSGAAAGGTPPAASGNPPGLGGLSTAAQITAAVSALIPAGTTPNVVSVAGGGYGGAVVAGTLNAYVATTSGAGAVVSVPAGFGAGYLLAGTATLQDATGGVVLVDTAAGGAVTGMAADTLFGGDGGDMLTATSGAETLIGGTGSNSFFLGASSAFVESQGSDIITGSSAAETVNASGSALYFGTSGATTFNASGTGGDTIIGGGAGNTVQGGGGAQLIFGSTTLNYTGGAGAATIIGGGGGNSVTGGSGNELIFASSSLTFNGTGGAATIIGGGGPMIVNLGAGGGLVYGSPGGNDTLASGSGTAIMVGGGGGDVLVASGAANDTLVAGGGAETLSGAGSTGNLVLFGGPGDDTLAGGSGGNLFIAESGNETLVGGGSSDSYVFVATPGTTRTDVIVGFNPNVDAIGLFGYGGEPGADQAALASATVTGGNTVLSLSDGTSIVLVGTPALQSYNFF